jgi:hypothetical protein
MAVAQIGEELRAGAGACWDYSAAMLAAQELVQNSQLRHSSWLMAPPVSTPALNLSTGHQSGAFGFEAAKLLRFQRDD